MTIDRKYLAALGLHRFGFGPVRDEIAAIAGDPRGAVLADLERPQAGQVTAANLPSSGEAARERFEYRAEEAAKRKLAERAKKVADAKGATDAKGAKATKPGIADAGKPPGAATATAESADAKPPMKAKPQLPAQLIQNEAKVRFDAAINAEIGFVERLVWFWSNHFCISANKIFSMAGSYEREAIRPHVLGHFADLLLAAESHPAMLFYLDNEQSMGADSIAGINRDKGINENLARETLELHTLGVRSGYTQADVISFANTLTGWTFIGPAVPRYGGEFSFIKRFHEPGGQTVLGKRYPDTGIDQGRAVLADLAHNPATAHHIAQKLAAHFVADQPPPVLVAKLEKSFMDSGGDLKDVARTLVSADEAWAPSRTKLKSPAEWIAGTLRLTGAQWVIPVGRVMAAQAALGEPLWRPAAPNGYSDTEAAWIDGVPHRIDIASEFAGRLANGLDPLALLDSSLGPLATGETRDTIGRAESRTQALALLVMTPEFLRR